MNAKNAGLNVEIAFCPCKIVNPEKHVDEIMKKLDGANTIDRVWF